MLVEPESILTFLKWPSELGVSAARCDATKRDEQRGGGGGGGGGAEENLSLFCLFCPLHSFPATFMIPGGAVHHHVG